MNPSHPNFTVLGALLLAGALLIPVASAGEQGGGIRKPCKPPRCGKALPAGKNEVAIESLEIKPREQSGAHPAAMDKPAAPDVPRLSNDEQFPAVRH